MMDSENVVSNYQSLVAAAGAILSDKSVDLGASDTIAPAFQAVGSPFHDYGRGRTLFCFVKVTEEFDSAGDAVTCKCSLIMADNAALTTNATVLYETPAIAQASLLVGYVFRLGSLPPGITKRYIGFKYTTATADATAGKVFAAFLPDMPSVRVTSSAS